MENFNVGLTINDHIYSLKKPNIKILEKKLNISFDKPLNNFYSSSYIS